MRIAILIVLLIHTVDLLELKKLSTCQTALGMQSGAIPDSAITVSSSYDPNTVGAKASRARTEQYGGAWCSLNQINAIPQEWLEIDFGNLTYLTQVETQGRFDNGRGKEYADYYVLMYTRANEQESNELSWMEYKPKGRNNNSSTWIMANHNTYMGEVRQLSPPIIAKRLRFYPVSHRTRTVCMRFEVYGCSFSDGIVSYSMPQGYTNRDSFADDTYDGKYIPSSNMLIDGLGQLSDGVTGSEDISMIDGRQPWIGWSNDSRTHVSIVFRFDFIRQINRVTIHANNLFSKDIFIFKTAVISFSSKNEDTNYSQAIIYQHPRDDIFEIARPILIELKNRVAKFVRVDLYFDSTWLLISEITFDSQRYSDEPIRNADVKEKLAKTIVTDSRKRNREIAPLTSMIVSATSSTTAASAVLTFELSLAFVIGASLAVGLLLVVSLVWILRQKKKLQFQKLTEKPCHHSSCYTYPTLPVREFYDYNAPVSSAIDDRDYAMPDVNFYSTFSPKHHLQSPRSTRASTTNSNTIRSYRTLKPVPPCCVFQDQEQHLNVNPLAATVLPLHDDVPSVEAACGNSLILRMSPVTNDHPTSTKEIHSDDLILKEKIGGGLFGSIHLAEWKTSHQENKTETTQVIVKALDGHADEHHKTTFAKEIDLLSTLNHPHVCVLLGTSNYQRTVAVFDYYSLDLYQYLRQQSIPMDNSAAFSFLLTLACQIASGMKYLSSLHLIHRDVAARNCLISPTTHQIHLSDIAMAKGEYSNDYARVGPLQTRIALRWAAWESIFLNQFSLKSDTWSFGVTLYELFTYARQRPYHTLTNEQFVQQLAFLSQIESPANAVTKDLHLPQPELCTKEIYDMMCECWQRDAARRPSFSDIHIFLIGKTAGSTSSNSPGRNV